MRPPLFNACGGSGVTTCAEKTLCGRPATLRDAWRQGRQAGPGTQVAIDVGHEKHPTREGEVPPSVCFLPGNEIVTDLTPKRHTPSPFTRVEPPIQSSRDLPQAA